MAEQATQEPSMEEILSTIRRIISEDGEDGETAAKAESAPTAQNDATDPLDDLLAASELSEAPTNSSDNVSTADEIDDILDLEEFQFDAETLAEPEPEPEPEVTAEQVLSPEAAAEPAMQVPDIELEPAVVDAQPEPEPEPYTAPEPVAAAPVMSAPSPEPEPQTVETAMPTSTRYEETVLTEEATADKAAGALGRLISGMDLGGENTIEGLVREMLKPMIKEWLDANLPQIVEDKVEAEVQRIAKMVR